MAKKKREVVNEDEVRLISKESGIDERRVKDLLEFMPEFIKFYILDNEDKAVVFSFKTFGQFKFVPRFLDRLTLKRNGRPRNNGERNGEIQSDNIRIDSVQETSPEEDI